MWYYVVCLTSARHREELAIAAKGTDIVTADEDLLALAEGHDDSAKRFRQRLPGVRVIEPAGFLKVHVDHLRPK